MPVDPERDAIRRAEEHLTERYSVVVDDVVLRTWGNGQAELVQLLLTAAIESSGAAVDARELWPVSRSIAHPNRGDSPWRQVPAGDGAAHTARSVARSFLLSLPDGGRRWRHTIAVAERAREAGRVLSPADAATLEAAAWLHDIGYAPEIAVNRFHPVDGADHVRDRLGLPAVAGFVAHHSGARYIAAVRDLSPLLDPYDRPEYWTSPVADALTWADQTTDPSGHIVDLEDRLTEMLGRHGRSSPNARAHRDRAPSLRGAVEATETRMAAQLHPSA